MKVSSGYVYNLYPNLRREDGTRALNTVEEVVLITFLQHVNQRLPVFLSAVLIFWFDTVLGWLSVCLAGLR